MDAGKNGVPKKLTAMEFWRDDPIDAQDDGALEATAQAAFDWYHRAVAANIRLDLVTIDRLVTLQREYLRRFPTGDLSASVVRE